MDKSKGGTPKRSRKAEAEARSEAARKKLGYIVGLKPNPRELRAEIGLGQISFYKLLTCPSYLFCVNVAAIARWEGLTCRLCPVFKRFCEQPSVRVLRKAIDDE